MDFDLHPDSLARRATSDFILEASQTLQTAYGDKAGIEALERATRAERENDRGSATTWILVYAALVNLPVPKAWELSAFDVAG